MGYGKVVARKIGRLREFIDEGRVGIVDDLAVTVVLHHDHEDVIQMRDALRDSAFLGENRTGERDAQQAQNCYGFFHGDVLL